MNKDSYLDGYKDGYREGFNDGRKDYNPNRHEPEISLWSISHPPTFPPAPDKCPVCGISGLNNYCCNRNDCPSRVSF